MKKNKLTIFMPRLPPGINRQYGRSSKRVYLTKEAKQWKTDFALIVGATAGRYNWQDDSEQYGLIIIWWGGRHDVDAHTKIVQDTLCEKLGFNDRKIFRQVIIKLDPKAKKHAKFNGEKGILVILFNIK